MKCNLVNLFFIFLLGILFSCEENIISDTNPRIDVVTKSVDTINSFSFIYNGEIYESEYVYNNDSTIVFLSDVVEFISKQLENNANLASFVHEDGMIEYFDNVDELQKGINPLLPEVYDLNFTSKITTSATLVVFQKDKCKGRTISSQLNSSIKNVKISTEILNENNMHDEISSIDLVCTYMINESSYTVYVGHGNKCIATFYEHENYSGHSIWFAVDPNSPHCYIHYFKSYPLYPGSSKNWNDKVSSYTFSYDSY